MFSLQAISILLVLAMANATFGGVYPYSQFRPQEPRYLPQQQQQQQSNHRVAIVKRQPQTYGGFGIGLQSNTGGPRAQPETGPNVQCTYTEDAGGYNINCPTPAKDQLTLKYNHILWLDYSAPLKPINIPIDNYYVEEHIGAGVNTDKSAPVQKVNVFVSRPQKTVSASVDIPNIPIKPSVNVQYERPPAPITVHYPNDRPYTKPERPLVPPGY